MVLKDKIAVITGSTSGLGKALAQALKKEGAVVVINSRDKAETTKAAAEMDAFGVAADVAKEKDIARLAERVMRKFGRIDIWINNAGIWIPHGPIEDLDMKRVCAMVEVNLLGTMYGSKTALTIMKKQGSGSIINILSTSALAGRAESSAYCATKHGAAGFTKSLQLEVRGSKIEAIAIYPGEMKTNLFGKKEPADINAYMSPDLVAKKIIKNLLRGKPKEELIIRT